MSTKKVPIQEEFNWQLNVKSRITGAVRDGLSPAKGDRYLLTDGANIDKICYYDGSIWQYLPVSEGYITWVDDEDLYYKFNGSVWSKFVVPTDGLVNPTNLLLNGDFEYWSAGASAAPDNYTLQGSGATIARESSIIKLKTYSCKITRNGADASIYQYFHTDKGMNYWIGRTVTIGCWVYATVANRAKIGIMLVGMGAMYSSYHTGNSLWQFLTVTTTLIYGGEPSLGVILKIDTGDTSAYFDGAICVEGESIYAFSPKPLSGDVAGEINSLTEKTTPVDADITLIEDSAATPTNQKKKLSWANIKATLKTYFDTLYTIFVKNDGTVNPTNILSNGDFESWSAGVSNVVDQQQTTDFAEVWIGDGADTEYRIAQSFTLTSPKVISGISIYHRANSGSPSGQITWTIETDSSGSPSGTLADANLSKAVTPTASAWNDIMFNIPTLLVAGTYWIVSHCNNQATNVRWTCSRSETDLYVGGTATYSANGGSTWNVTTYDDVFKVYVQIWNAPDGWTLSGAGASVAREASTIKLGTYSAKLTRGGATAQLLVSDALQAYVPKGINYWKGRKVTFYAWVYATVADRGQLFIWDGVSVYASSFHTGNSTWQLLSVTATIDASATALSTGLQVITGDTSVYIDGAMCVEGSSIFAFSPKPAEEGVWADYSAISTITGWSSYTNKQICYRKIGNIVFIIYYIAGTSNSTDTKFTLPYTNQSIFIRNFAFIQDNGATPSIGVCGISPDASTADFYKDISYGAWTNSGTKYIVGQFWYEVA